MRKPIRLKAILDKRKFLIVWRQGKEEESWEFFIEHLPLREGAQYLMVANEKIWKSLVKRGVIA
jgi:hypothetical protein